jgi:hypothetical protein
LKTEDEAWKLDNRNNMKKETRNKKRSLHERTNDHGHGMAWCFGRFFFGSQRKERDWKKDYYRQA